MAKPTKIRRDFQQLQNSIGTDKDIVNRNKQEINYDPSHVRRKKLVKFGALTKKVIGAHIDPPKVIFGRLYFGP